MSNRRFSVRSRLLASVVASFIPAAAMAAGTNIVTNSGTMDGGAGPAIDFHADTDPAIITNSGTIKGGAGVAILTGSGDDTLNLSTGSNIIGLVNLGGGYDTINLNGSGAAFNAVLKLGKTLGGERLNVNSGSWLLAGEVNADLVSIAGNAVLNIDDIAAQSAGGAFITAKSGVLTVSNNGSLILNTTDTRTDAFADNLHLSGTGNLYLGGGGTLQYGQNVTLTGSTTIGNGTLVVTGNNIPSPLFIGEQSKLLIGAGFSPPDADGYVTIVGAGTSGSINGPINNLNLVTFNRADDSAYAGVISRTGRVVKQGAGTLTLAGENTYTGGTTISGGTLQIGNGGTTGSIVGNVVNNANLVFDHSDAVTFGGVISGSGGVTQTGAGMLTLTADNTYTGVTTIDTGSTLKLGVGGTTGSVAGDILNNGALIVDRNVPFPFYYGAISGAGTLNKVGSGSLVLMGENTYTGLTTVEAGVLQIGGGGSTGSITGDVLLASGHLSFVRSDTSTYGGNVSGSGQVNKAYTGTLILTGNLTHTGTTRIEAGTLQIGNGGTTGSVTGVIANAGALVFNRSDDTTFTGSVSGAGTVTKLGTNTLTVTGGLNSTGGATITAGTLKIGNGGTTGSLSGNVVNNGALVFDRSTPYVYTGSVSGTGSVTKAGNDELQLYGALTHTGGTNVTGGSLRVRGSITGLTSLSSGTTLIVMSGASMRFVNGNGATITNAGTIETPLVTTGAAATIVLGDAGNTINNSGVIRSYNGNAIRLGAGADTLNLSTGSAITGRVDMGGGLDTVNLAGTLTTKAATQTFGNIFGSEVTNVNSGYWTLNAELGADRVNIASGATFEIDDVAAFNSGGAFITPATGGLTVANSGAVVINSPDTHLDATPDALHLSGAGTVELTGGGALQYGQNVTLTGRTTITNGTLVVSGDNIASPFTVGAQGILRIGAAYSAPDADGHVTIGAGGGGSGSITGDIVSAGQVIFDRADNTTYSGAITGTGLRIAKRGGGVLTYTGSSAIPFLVDQGGLIVTGTVSPLGTSVVSPGASLTIASTGKVGRLGGSGATITNAGTIDYTNPGFGGAMIELGTASTVNNSGVIGGGSSGLAIRFRDEADTLNLVTGSTITGRVEMGGGVDTINLAGTLNTKTTTQSLGKIFGSEVLNVNSGYWTLLGEVAADNLNVASGATFEIDDIAAQPGGAFLTPSGADLTIANSGAVILNTADTRTDVYADTLHLGGAGTVELRGGGTLQYGQKVTLTGATTVTNGMLVVTGDNLATPITVGAQGTLRVGAAYSAPDVDGYATIVAGGGATGSLSGNVVNNGAVIFDRSNASTYAGAMSGTGTLTKAGAGGLTLSGANTYTGATTVTGGGLVVSAPFASSGVSLASGTGLTFTGANALTYAGVVSGAGGLTKTGAGVTTLSGANTYTGATTVSAGGLSVTGSIASQSVAVAGGATFTFGSASAQTYTGVVSGAGAVTKSGAGALTLTGANTYTGATTVSGGSLILATTLGSNVTVNQGGTLQIGTGGTTGSLTGSLRADGTVIFNRSDNYVYAGAFSGNGSLIKRGAGLLTLDGLYTFSGTTSIEGGTIKITQLDAGGSLVVGSGSTVDLSGGSQTVGGLSGGTGSTINIQNATLTINQPTSGAPTVFNGALTGSGSLVVTGSGVTDLAGTNTYTGPTTVNGGTLKVNGSVTSNVTVNNGGTLGGSGTIGGAVTIGAGGSISPGNSPGVTNIAGPLTLASGSNFIVEVDPTATIKNDRINVTAGAATIVAGAKLDVRPLGAIANYGRVNDYIILTATGGVNGTFGANVTSTMALLTPSVSYSANQVSLRLIRNDISFASLADTANQAAVAAAAEGSGPSGPAYGALVGQDAAGARTGYDALSGELYGAASTLVIDESRHQRAALLGQAASSGTGAWARLHDGEATTDATADSAEARDRSFGVTGGGQIETGAWNLGFGLAYGKSDIDLAARASTSDVETLRAGVYAGGEFGAWRVGFGADAARHDFDAKRAIVFPTVSESLTAQYDGSSQQLFGEVAYALRTAGGSLEPFVELAGVRAKTDAFGEAGGTLGLSVDAQTRNLTFATVGARYSGVWNVGSGSVRPQVSVAWRRAGGDIEGTSTAGFGTSSFTVVGASIAKDTALIDAGLGFDLSKSVTGSVSYSGALSSDAKDNAVRAGLSVRF